VKVVQCDIREAEAVAQMMDAIWADGPLDVLVNNAAGTMLARSETLSARAFDAVLRVSLNGAVYATLEAGRRWIDGQRPGVVLCILASGMQNGRPFMMPLTVAKGGLLTMIKSLAVEWGRHGIRLLGVAPGNSRRRARPRNCRPAAAATRPCRFRLAVSANTRNWPTCARFWSRTRPASSAAR